MSAPLAPRTATTDANGGGAGVSLLLPPQEISNSVAAMAAKKRAALRLKSNIAFTPLLVR
jgi:hypothetical protein